ncbi:hypothetical protein KSP39_PZI020965 [Platanthera zijinensis]|uniref:U1-type domain-containing protein n=1 Tax=Platanthera zijinensis TaxID=2320716 RepID=A0AAP0FVL0_9ASPA
MDFHLQAGKDDPSLLCSPPNGYFVSKVPHEMHDLPPPLPDHKALLRRKIMKEGIRQEILAREMAERMILEAEVRREIKIERMEEMRRIQMVKLALLGGTSHMANQGNQLTQQFYPSWPQPTGWSSQHFEQDVAEYTFRERSQPHLLKKKPTAAVPESSLHPKSEKLLPSEENTTSNFKLSGAKRKNHEASPLPVKKRWGCALCEVHTTCENSLKAHLEGKKHKAKEASIALTSLSRKEPLLSSEKASHPQPKKYGALPLKGALASGPKNKKLPPVKGASTLQMKDTSASGPKNKKQPPLKGASGGGPGKRFWCPVCKVKCNSEKMLESHRTGKKHKIFRESMKDSNSFANKNIGDTGAKGFVKEVAETGAGLTDGEQLGTGDGN